MQTSSTYRMDKQGPTVQHKKYIQYPVINQNQKEYEKEHIYICMYKTESLCTAEVNSTL